ncbi:hypothetical protein IAE35_11450 [Pseudomonas sp. S75]|uniref:hypothetical protein n=1 Tax=unclassified Pseudomonas TaxID=196821 RepID=UPI001903E51B|nr:MULTISPECIES: hypothetical protein [unclassified Pseudomonas]MBJ9977050.1 hypothetical protein [Pseudomonas sp. S30]MBK0153954.1 hypothetical protein [Pseudomonas sp. S75]
MIISMPDTWKHAKDEHKAYLSAIIQNFIDHDIPKAQSPHSKNFVISVRRAILSNSRRQMEWSIHKLLHHRPILGAANYALLIKDLKKIFNYSRFRDKPHSKLPCPPWNAYDLCRKSTLTTCPYCNYNYAHTVFKDKKTGKLRPTLDHFYPQSLYPHLGLSLANLIPSCYSCNSSLKGDEDFFKTQHLHPFFDREAISFACAHPTLDLPRVLAEFEKVRDQLQIKLESATGCIRSKNSIGIFALTERYEKFTKEAVDFIGGYLALESLVGNLETATAKNPGERLNLDIPYIKSHVLRFDAQYYRGYPLGKMFADLLNQFNRRTKP